jgi:hypothetical protein
LHRIFQLEECITPNNCSRVLGSRKSRGKFGDFAWSFLGFSRVFVLGNEITFDNIIIHNAKIEKSTHSENDQPRVSPPPPPTNSHGSDSTIPVTEYVFINNSISAPGDYKLYSLEHSSTAFLLKLRYHKPPNIRPGIIFVGKDFLMGLYNRGGGEVAYVWGAYVRGAYIRTTFSVSNNIYCTCKS